MLKATPAWEAGRAARAIGAGRPRAEGRVQPLAGKIFECGGRGRLSAPWSGHWFLCDCASASPPPALVPTGESPTGRQVCFNDCNSLISRHKTQAESAMDAQMCPQVCAH
jgi:hypothetical protein